MKKYIINSVLMCAAGLIVYLCSCLYISDQAGTVRSEAANQDIEENIDQEIDNPAFSYSDHQADETEEENWTPSPDELNLTHIFPEGADTDDITASYAGMAFQELMKEENSWWVKVYSNTDLTPSQLAAQLGKSEDSIIGRYDSSDKSQDPEDSSTWAIRHFSKTHMNVFNGDGNHRNQQSNIIDIMSMANVYTYYHDIEDYDLFLSYAKDLLSKSHSYTISMSDVYYCSGECVDGDEEEEDEISLEDWEETGTSVIHNYATPSDAEESQTDSSVAENISDINNESSVIVAGITAQLLADSTDASDSGSEGTSDGDSGSVAAHGKATSSNAEKTCPGHIDLTINVRIYGMEDTNSLFERDTIGNTVSGEGDSLWQGWGEEQRSYARSLSEKDWYENYGLTLSPFTLGNSLTQSEIQEYLDKLPSGLSAERKAIVEFALSSVGKVPYYWGGKASRAGYEGNNFGILVESDQEGRILKGLDCSGWISWVYWSVTGEHLPYESTAGLVSLGKSISKYEMQPGDIALRTGDNAHVIMFLGWTDDGRILCVHESSDRVNNVTISIKNDNWTNYRNILD